MLLVGMLGVATAQAPRPAETNTKVAPKFQAVAETKLLMEGLAQANYRGLESLLKQKPGDDATWAFARGRERLLIAETGNLLLLRPPRRQGPGCLVPPGDGAGGSTRCGVGSCCRRPRLCRQQGRAR